MPAHITAKIVMASAKRLIDVRHFWRNRKRMAEISVPAWPMPIQKTKLTMASPSPRGCSTTDGLGNAVKGVVRQDQRGALARRLVEVARYLFSRRFGHRYTSSGFGLRTFAK
jgi:hypothetical protein